MEGGRGSRRGKKMGPIKSKFETGTVRVRSTLRKLFKYIEIFYQKNALTKRKKKHMTRYCLQHSTPESQKVSATNIFNYFVLVIFFVPCFNDTLH